MSEDNKFNNQYLFGEYMLPSYYTKEERQKIREKEKEILKGASINQYVPLKHYTPKERKLIKEKESRILKNTDNN